MATDVCINDQGDFEQDDKGSVAMVNGLDEIAQSCMIALNTRKGGWVLDTNEGLDWGAVIGSNVHDQFVTAAIRETLLEDPRIDDIHDVDFEREARVLKVHITIEVKNQLKEVVWEAGVVND